MVRPTTLDGLKSHRVWINKIRPRNIVFPIATDRFLGRIGVAVNGVHMNFGNILNAPFGDILLAAGFVLPILPHLRDSGIGGGKRFRDRPTDR